MKDIVKQFKEFISKLTPEEFKKIWDEIGTDYPVFNTKTLEAGVEFAQKWVDINKESPQYYQTVLADNGEYMAVVSRVSDGDEDLYPIRGTDFYMYPNPIKWRLIELK